MQLADALLGAQAPRLPEAQSCGLHLDAGKMPALPAPFGVVVSARTVRVSVGGAGQNGFGTGHGDVFSHLL